MKSFGSRARLCVSLLAMSAATTAAADEVTLRANDGSFELVGEVVGFDNVVYRLQTKVGVVNVRVDNATCEGASCPRLQQARRNAAEDDTVTIAGSDTLGEGLMPILLSGYAGHLDAGEEIIKPDGAIEAVSKFIAEGGFGDDIGSYLVRSSISSDAFANMLGRSADIGMASRRITPEEADVLARYGAGDMNDPTNEHIVAIDSLLIVTHPDNPVRSITMEQLQGIYNGKITNWSQLGGRNAPIKSVHLSEGSGTRSVFEDRVFEGGVAGTPSQTIQASDAERVADLIVQDENSIGYVSAAFTNGAEPVTLVSSCGIPMTPDAFSARTEEYSLGRFLYLYTRGDNVNPEVRNLVNYATSAAADEVIAKSGFVDLGVDRRAGSSDTARAAALSQPGANAFETSVQQKMLDKMADHDRLSTTFRFDFGSNRLTPRSKLNIERLAAYLEDMPQGTEVTLVGFTDEVGSFSRNLDLAEARSAEVLRTLRRDAGDRLSHIELATAGYGEIAPAACNTDDYGRSINRRVEVWIKS